MLICKKHVKMYTYSLIVKEQKLTEKYYMWYYIKKKRHHVSVMLRYGNFNCYR